MRCGGVRGVGVRVECLVRRFKGVYGIFGALFRSGRGSGCGLLQYLGGSLGGGVVNTIDAEDIINNW